MNRAAAASALAREWLPPPVTRWLRARFGLIHFAGAHGSWQQALHQCKGYDDVDIVQRVEAAALAVKNGQARFERDGVLLPRIEYQLAVLSGLLLAASHARDGRLRVLDFGGGLGTSYRQNRVFLAGLAELRWCIVEQPAFVASGKRHFEDGIIEFLADLDACLAGGAPDVVLLSSVLPYVEAPHALLQRLLSARPRVVIVDRTPFIDAAEDRLCVQTVSARQYAASYPAWFFSRTRFLRAFGGDYRLLEEFDSPGDLANIQSRYLGFVFGRSAD
jgi:putative methyltransferase (TIGR04325 family)